MADDSNILLSPRQSKNILKAGSNTAEHLTTDELIARSDKAQDIDNRIASGETVTIPNPEDDIFAGLSEQDAKAHMFLASETNPKMNAAYQKALKLRGEKPRIKTKDVVDNLPTWKDKIKEFVHPAWPHEVARYINDRKNWGLDQKPPPKYYLGPADPNTGERELIADAEGFSKESPGLTLQTRGGNFPLIGFKPGSALAEFDKPGGPADKAVKYLTEEMDVPIFTKFDEETQTEVPYKLPPPIVLFGPALAATATGGAGIAPLTTMSAAEAWKGAAALSTATGLSNAFARQLIGVVQGKPADEVAWDTTWGFFEGLVPEWLIFKAFSRFGGTQMGIQWMEKQMNMFGGVSSPEAQRAANFAARTMGKTQKQGWLSRNVEKWTGGKFKWITDYNVPEYGLTAVEQADNSSWNGLLTLLQTVAEKSPIAARKFKEFRERSQTKMFSGFRHTKKWNQTTGKMETVPKKDSFLWGYVAEMGREFGGMLSDSQFGKMTAAIANDLFDIEAAPAIAMRKRIVDEAGEELVDIRPLKEAVRETANLFTTQGGESGVSISRQVYAGLKGLTVDELPIGDGMTMVIDDFVPLKYLADPFTGLIATLGRVTRNQTKQTPMTSKALDLKTKATAAMKQGLDDFDPKLSDLWDEQAAAFTGLYKRYKTAWLDGMFKQAFIDSGKQGARPDKLLQNILAAGPDNIKKLTGMMNEESKLSLKHMVWKSSLADAYGAGKGYRVKILDPDKLEKVLYGEAGVAGKGGLGEEALGAIIGKDGIAFADDLINYLRKSQETLGGEGAGGVASAMIALGGAGMVAAGALKLIKGEITEGLGQMTVGTLVAASPQLMEKLLLTPYGKRLITRSFVPNLRKVEQHALLVRMTAYTAELDKVFGDWLQKDSSQQYQTQALGPLEPGTEVTADALINKFETGVDISQADYDKHRR